MSNIMSRQVIVDGVFLVVVDLTSIVARLKLIGAVGRGNARGQGGFAKFLSFSNSTLSRISVNLKCQCEHRNGNALPYIDWQ